MRKISVHKSTGVSNKSGTDDKSSDLNIVTFITIDKNLPVDYYLTLSKRTLAIFKNQTL
jgi:serum/glucocorticoid-regulated kinase 2